MPHPTRQRLKDKPAKPYPDFPLFPHATKRWAKKIRGKLVYFGPWEDPDGALKKYQEQRDDLRAGRKPRTADDGLDVRDLLNRFLTAKRHLLDTSEITQRTFDDYHTSCARVGASFGLSRRLDDVRPEDFERLRMEMAKTWGPARLKMEQPMSDATLPTPGPDVQRQSLHKAALTSSADPEAYQRDTDLQARLKAPASASATYGRRWTRPNGWGADF